MNVVVLHVAACPNVGPLLTSLDEALGGHAATVRARTVSSVAEAAALGMHGSPTLLIDGRDPFVGPSDAGLSCRLYPTEDGLRGRPSIAQLRAVLRERP